jgi:hypothetical protein
VIPRAHITAWRVQAPWPADAQVEQDLVLCRALTEMYGRPELAALLAFRGGTALHKLHVSPPGRYSEDIDLVSRAMFEANLAEKLDSKPFRDDVYPLLRDGASYDVDIAGALVGVRLLERLPGEPWKKRS